MYTLSTFSVVADMDGGMTGFPATFVQGRTDFNISLETVQAGVSFTGEVLSVHPVVAHYNPVGGVIRVLKGAPIERGINGLELPGHLLYTDFSGACSVTFELHTATEILYTSTFLYQVVFNPAYSAIYSLYGIHPPIFQDGIQVAPLLEAEVVEPTPQAAAITPFATFSVDTAELAELKRRVQQLEIIVALQAGNQLAKQENGGVH